MFSPASEEYVAAFRTISISILRSECVLLSPPLCHITPSKVQPYCQLSSNFIVFFRTTKVDVDFFVNVT